MNNDMKVRCIINVLPDDVTKKLYKEINTQKHFNRWLYLALVYLFVISYLDSKELVDLKTRVEELEKESEVKED